MINTVVYPTCCEHRCRSNLPPAQGRIQRQQTTILIFLWGPWS